MSYFGAASSVGGGGFRFGAPSSSGASSSSGAGVSNISLTTAAGSPPLTIQVLQKSNRPKLQMIMTQINACKAKAATVVKGSASQKQFNAQYCGVIGTLATAVRDVDEELFLAVDVQNMMAKAGGSSTNTNKLDPKKIPSSVSIHSLAKDLAIYVTSAREVTLGLPYLEMIAKPAIQSVVEKETAHERTAAAKETAKNRKNAASNDLIKNATAGDAASSLYLNNNASYNNNIAGYNQLSSANNNLQQGNNGSVLGAGVSLQHQQQLRGGAGQGMVGSGGSGAIVAGLGVDSLRKSPALMPHSLVVGGLPSPLQRTASDAMALARAGKTVGGLDDLLPPPLSLPTSIGPNGGASAQHQQAAAAPRVHENPALKDAIQPWLIPYPFSHGVKTDRVQAVRSAVARSQKANHAVHAFMAKHPKKAAAVIEKLPQQLLQQHQGYGQQMGGNKMGGGTKISPALNPLQQQQGGAYVQPPVPADVLLPYMLAYGGLTRAQCYGLAPKILEICACPTAGDMLHMWEQREAVFEVLLNAPAVGANTLGQISSINAQANPLAGPTTNSHGSKNNSGAHVSLAMRSGELGSYDNSQLYLGSPTLKPLHQTPPMRPLAGPGDVPPLSGGGLQSSTNVNANNNGGRTSGRHSDPTIPVNTTLEGFMTPLVLAGEEPFGGGFDALPPLGMGNAASLSHFGPPATGAGGAAGAGNNNNGAPQRRKAFFPHRCSNPSLSTTTQQQQQQRNQQQLNSPPNGPNTAGAQQRSSTFTVTNTANNVSAFGRASGLLANTASGTNSPTIAANPHPFGGGGGKRPREDDPYANSGAIPPHRSTMFDVSPVLFGADPLMTSTSSAPNNQPTTASAAIVAGHASPQPMKPMRGGPVPSIRASSSQSTAAAGLLSPTVGGSSVLGLNNGKEGTPSMATNGGAAGRASEAQPFMNVSGRVMSCLLHFGVVTTELPMVVGTQHQHGKRHGKHH